MKVGHNTPEVDAAGMGYTDGSCCEDKIGHGALPARATGGEIKERRGGGVRYEGRGVRVETRPDAGKKEKHTVHKDGECGTMPWPRENGEQRVPTQTAFCRARSTITQHA